MSYQTTYTLRHNGSDLEICCISSPSPFPSVSVGDFINAGSLPPIDPQTSRYKVVELAHESQELSDGVRHYTFVWMSPERLD